MTARVASGSKVEMPIKLSFGRNDAQIGDPCFPPKVYSRAN